MTDEEFRKLFNKAYKDLVSTFNQSTLRRTTTSQAAKNILLGLETRIDKYKNNPKLEAKQLTQLNNMIEELKTKYINRVNKKSGLIDREKNKAFKLKLKEDIAKANIEKSISPNIKKIPTTSSPSMVGSLVDSLGGFTKSKKTGTAVGFNRPDKINFNLKGFALIRDIAYNSLVHGYLDTDIDKGVADKKITQAEANNIKSFFNKENIKSQVSQIGTVEKKAQFDKPQFQRAFNSFLQNQYNEIFTKMEKDITPKKEGASSRMTKPSDKKFRAATSGAAVTGGGGPKSAMQQALGMYDPFSNPGPMLKAGGKVKRTKPKAKPYAMGGKVYSNSVRKPNY